MTLITNQTIIFSNSPLKGFYKYKDLFQIFPPKKQNELFQHDHPLVLEMQFDDEIYPIRSQNYWYRDDWEEERFEFIKRRSPKRKMDLEDPWVQAYQTNTKMLRSSAILNEVLSLLTLFSHYRFFIYDGKQHWFIHIEPGEKEKKIEESIWGQPIYISEYGGAVQSLTNIDCEQLPFVPTGEYYKRFRDTRGYTEDDQVDFPDNINFLFDIYFSLPSIKKTAYYMACHLYNEALFFQRTIPSLSMVSSVMAIEN